MRDACKTLPLVDRKSKKGEIKNILIFARNVGVPFTKAEYNEGNQVKVLNRPAAVSSAYVPNIPFCPVRRADGKAFRHGSKSEDLPTFRNS